MKVFVYRLGCFLYLQLWMYAIKSWCYRWIWERHFRYVTPPRADTVEEVLDIDRTWTWTKDGPKQLWDAFSYPGAMYSMKKGDCDEFAVALAHIFLHNRIPGYLNPRIGTVMWINDKGGTGGHNVCVLDLPDGRVAYMDYGLPEAYKNLADMALAIRLKYAGEKSISLGWSISDAKTLGPIEVHWA